MKTNTPAPKAVKDKPVDTGKEDNKEKIAAKPAKVKEEDTKDVG